MDLKAAKTTIFLATSDAESARNFYEEKLGLTLASDEPYALVYQMAGSELRLSKVPSFTPLPFTVLDWQVEDILAAHKTLSERGVEFTLFDGMGQDEKGIWASPDGGARILWFKDPDGNVLSVSERS
ncbi:MAG: VOC family protein [Henriciella sp.]|mmetsp:Transcript_30701/g.39481  ORF Transcript_30701/g.39481 Transcript_30701/m.39481 type:complete len:127 (-) Transcript_30701:1185-1565(-)